MAENHLEYGYLEGESFGVNFTEDPVSSVAFAGNTNGSCCVCLFVSRMRCGQSHYLAAKLSAAWYDIMSHIPCSMLTDRHSHCEAAFPDEISCT